ncbi:MAG TPA: HmuY family protein [Cyclobacteriaceae bacterium]|nr:HmuY family protein [Cyclobacteriaceae bacterium]
MRKLSILHLALLSTVMMFSCSDDEETQPEEDLQVVLVENLHAPADEMDRQTGEIIALNSYKYYSFEENKLIESSDGNWDLGIKGLSMIVNNGISGNGNAEATIVQGIFEQYNEIPQDLILKVDTEEGLAIPGGSGNGWYNYNMSTHVVSPQPGNILIIKTNAGNYVKMEVLSYYQDNPPLNEVDLTTPSAYYTFQYVLQPNGSRKF